MAKIVKTKTKKPTKLHDSIASERAREAIESYVQTLKDLDPETMAELAGTVSKVAGIMFPPRDHSDLVPASVPPLTVEATLEVARANRRSEINFQVLTLRDLLTVATNAKRLGDEWQFVVDYCHKLADEIVPDEDILPDGS